MMTRSHCYCFITIFFTLLLHTLASPPHHFCKEDQRDALLEFIAEFPTGESYTWNKSSDCCFWEGVTCNHRSGQVISLDLSYTLLNSSLKTNNSLFRLRSLRHLNLMDCNLRGEIPSSLGNLSRLLRVLSLGGNKLSGNFPIIFANLTKLSFLGLNFNNFTSTLPVNMSEFINLDQIYLNHNNFSGSIPRSISKLANLTDLHLSNNIISGEIPESISCLKELRLLNLSNNKFRNDIPRCISNLKNLETLDLSSNNLSGQIPQDLGNLSFLSYMNFSHNLLQGPVPRGTQFQRQKCSSFLDNPGLFGLEEICQQTHVPNPTSHQSEELSEAEEQVLNWIAAAIAYGPGLLCGLVMGHIFTSHNQ
ncbi:BnaC06g43780D [Brassica napus]|uniref:BnaC06g43780D protein n=1 Tax=Brassica napus TaxID=3708 RepID=A0A078JGT2_BRANA|nr:BnaC06g43780D [Brassica napus]